MIRFALVTAFALALAGCSVSTATRKHIDTQAAAHDGVARVISGTLSASMEGDSAIDNVTADDLESTPEPVKRLLRRTLRFIWESRESWHILRFTLGDGPDPSELDLGGPPPVPSGDPLGD